MSEEKAIGKIDESNVVQEVPEGQCPVCNGRMRAFAIKSRPQSSEWYCEKCHKSVLMKPDTAAYLLSQK